MCKLKLNRLKVKTIKYNNELEENKDFDLSIGLNHSIFYPDDELVFNSETGVTLFDDEGFELEIVYLGEFELKKHPTDEEKKKNQKKVFDLILPYINSTLASVLATVKLPPLMLSEEDFDINEENYKIVRQE